MKKPFAYTDTMANAVFNAFKDNLTPLLARVAPDWDLYHMEMERRPSSDFVPENDEVRILLVIKMGKFRGAPRNEPTIPRLD